MSLSWVWGVLTTLLFAGAAWLGNDGGQVLLVLGLGGFVGFLAAIDHEQDREIARKAKRRGWYDP